MTQRNVCLPLCPFFTDGTEGTWCRKWNDNGGHDEVVVGDPCSFNIGFEVRTKEQEEKIKSFIETTLLWNEHTPNQVRIKLLSVISSEKER